MVVRMTTNAQWIEEAVQKVNAADSEVVLDFAGVRRIDSSAVKALEQLAGMADERSVKVVLRAVNMDVYRVLKLLKLTERFAFLN
jgi:anti-anti-sigma regulatory factor